MFGWLEQLADGLVYQVFKLDADDHLAEALHFFIYHSIKIILLLVIVIFFMGLVNSFFPVERVKNYLTSHNLYGFEYLFASLFGVVTPFCSCSSVPLFIGFVRGGIPLGVTFAFLITSPLVNEVAIGLFIGLFGIKTTLIYVSTGILLGTISGFILQKLKLESLLTPWVQDLMKEDRNLDNHFLPVKISFSKRFKSIFKEALIIIKGILPYVIIGIALGGIMHGYIPEGFFETYLQKDNWFAVPIATLLAVPMYSNASGMLPVLQVLVSKGVPLGTAIAFMMGVVGLSLPEAMLLKKVMSFKLIAIFFSVVSICIIISGYLFNIFL